MNFRYYTKTAIIKELQPFDFNSKLDAASLKLKLRSNLKWRGFSDVEFGKQTFKRRNILAVDANFAGIINYICSKNMKVKFLQLTEVYPELKDIKYYVGRMRWLKRERLIPNCWVRLRLSLIMGFLLFKLKVSDCQPPRFDIVTPSESFFFKSYA